MPCHAKAACCAAEGNEVYERYACFACRAVLCCAAGDNEVYERQRPLPLEELYSDERPRAGVLSLLKYALWQALWAETAPSPGMPSCPCVHYLPPILCT